jgi:hypothetical protein
MTAKHTAKQAVAASFLLLAAVPANAQSDSGSVSWMLPGCREVMRGSPNNDPFRSGLCAGYAAGIAYAAPIVCPPTQATVQQLVAVVVRYVDQRPERWHERFKDVAAEALSKTWPCR